ASRARAVVAGQNDQQEAREVGPEQPLQTIGGRQTPLASECGTVRDQQARTSRDEAAVGCGAHAKEYRPDPAAASSLTGVSLLFRGCVARGRRRVARGRRRV